MFSIVERDRLRDAVLRMAADDARIVAGAVVGSLALGEGDRWSDLDLTFGVADGVPIQQVLEDWTRRLVAESDAVHLFDLPSGPSIYRVFLLPGCLQFDLSFTPAAQFGAVGPKFRMLFGRSVQRPHAQPPPAEELFGHAVHHALRARFCIERHLFWQAEYWIRATRDCALSLACRRRGLPVSYGRGFDELPQDVRDHFLGTFVTTLERDALLRALAVAIEGLLREAEEAADLAGKVERELRHLTVAWGE